MVSCAPIANRHKNHVKGAFLIPGIPVLSVEQNPLQFAGEAPKLSVVFGGLQSLEASMESQLGMARSGAGGRPSAHVRSTLLFVRAVSGLHDFPLLRSSKHRTEAAVASSRSSVQPSEHSRAPSSRTGKLTSPIQDPTSFLRRECPEHTDKRFLPLAECHVSSLPSANAGDGYWPRGIRGRRPFTTRPPDSSPDVRPW